MTAVACIEQVEVQLLELNITRVTKEFTLKMDSGSIRMANK